MPKLISRHQAGTSTAFVEGRIIFYNIALAQDMTHNLAKKIHGNNVMLKVDLAKTFDRVKWAYYSHVLSTFGFSASMVSIFQAYLSKSTFSICLNGTICVGYFPVSTYLR